MHPEKLLGWLYKTAQNAAINRRKAAQSRADHLPEGARFVSLDALPHAEQAIGSASIDAARQAAQKQERRERLARLLRLLSEMDQAMMDLFLDGFKPIEIAEALGLTPGATRKRLKRAEVWLRSIAPQLDELLRSLPAAEFKIMERYLDGQSPAEIAKHVALSPQAVSDKVARVIKQWRTSTREPAKVSVSTKVRRRINRG